MVSAAQLFPACDSRTMRRRQWLQWAGMGWLGAAWPAAFASRAGQAQEAQAGKSPITSCILVFHYGGPSHLETYDPKPDAPVGIRGDYGTISTAVPGIAVGEHLPNVARLMDRIALVRSMHHAMSNHNSAAAEGLTGRPPAGGDQELLRDEAVAMPTLGSTVAYGLGARAHVLPYVSLPYTIYNVVQIPGQTAGLLGAAFERFQVSGNPNAPEFRIPALELPTGRRAADVVARESLLRHLETSSSSSPELRMRALQQRARDLVATDAVRRGFQISEEPDALRERYGRSLLGQSLLLARRLVESGVNFVTVFDGQTNGQDANWDSHQNLFARHKQLIPPADQGLAALLEDLEERGRLDSTLVVAMGEFGRTPKVNAQGGRDHWPHCYTLWMAGGGVQGGAIYGASDRTGAYPARDPVTPADLAATVLWRFGIDARQEVRDPTGRPWRLSDGQPLASLFA